MTSTKAPRRRQRPPGARRNRSIGRAAGGATRVNARLDPETAAALHLLVGATGLSVTEVLKLSLLRLSEQQATPGMPVGEAFGDLIGCIDGPANLSVSYRAELAASLARKHERP